MIQDCITCKHSLSGGNCALNSERECADDDARPLWEPRTEFETIADAAMYVDKISYKGNYGATRRPDGRYELRLEGIK